MRTLTILAILLFITGCANGGTSAPQPLVTTYSVADFMGRLDDAIVPAAVAAKANGLLLKEVKLTFNIVLTDKNSGEIKILFIKIGGGSTQAHTTEYTVTLGAPDALADGVGNVSDDKFLRAFSEALEALVSDAAKYEVGDLVTHKVTASLKYFIQDTSSGGIDHEFEVVPISLKAGHTVTEDATQTILLTFEAPKKKKDKE